MRKQRNEAQDEVMYRLGGHAGIRLSKKSGATQEVVNLLNDIHDNKGNLSAEIIEAIKLKMELEKHYTRTQIDKLRKGGGFETGPLLDIDNDVPPKKKSQETKEKVTQEVKIRSSEEILFEEAAITTNILASGSTVNDKKVEKIEVKDVSTDSAPGIRTLNSMKNLKKR